MCSNAGRPSALVDLCQVLVFKYITPMSEKTSHTLSEYIYMHHDKIHLYIINYDTYSQMYGKIYKVTLLMVRVLYWLTRKEMENSVTTLHK